MSDGVEPVGRAESVPAFASEATSGAAETARAGHGPSIDDLWRESRRWVAAILLAYKPRDVDLDDLLQDVAVSVLRHGETIRDRAAFRPWVRTVAINAARASARSARLRRHASIDGEGDSSARFLAPPSGPQAPASEEARRLMELAMDLPDGYREPLLLKALQDMSYREIGAVMGLPESTVETRIARGRRMLRELAAASGLGEPAPVRTPRRAATERIAE